MRFRIAEKEKAVLEKLELDCLSRPQALNLAADIEMDYLNSQQRMEPPMMPITGRSTK